jgi:hypothetical protein
VLRDSRKYARCFLFVFIPAIFNVLSVNDAAPANGTAPWPPLTTDPIAQVPWLSLANWYSPTFHGAAASSNSVVIRVLLPFETGSLNHVARITIPFSTKAPPTEGQNDTSENISDLPLGAGNLGDITVYDLLVFRLLHGRFGVGPELQFPTGVDSASGSGKWCIGPAGGFMTERRPWQLGLFSQNLFSFAGDPNRSPVRQSKVQPIVKYSLGEGWSMGSSTMSFTYSWHRHSWRNVPIGPKVWFAIILAHVETVLKSEGWVHPITPLVG